MNYIGIITGVLFSSVIAAPTQAAVITYLWDEGGNVEARAKGTLDLSGTSFLGQGDFAEDFRIQSAGAGAEVLFFGPAHGYRVNGQIMQAFGTSAALVIEPGQSEGDHFGWESFEARNATNVLVPIGYTSGDPISATGRLLNRSIASLSLTVGTYTLSLPNDVITLKVGENPSPVGPAPIPLPAGLPLLLGGLLGLGWARRR